MEKQAILKKIPPPSQWIGTGVPARLLGPILSPWLGLMAGIATVDGPDGRNQGLQDLWILVPPHVLVMCNTNLTSQKFLKISQTLVFSYLFNKILNVMFHNRGVQSKV